MEHAFYEYLLKRSLANQTLCQDECLKILTDPEIELLDLVQAAFQIRKTYFGKGVRIHVINNAQNGFCPEDCNYCAQAKSSEAPIVEYPLKSDVEILAEAKSAFEGGAFRYCMVFAGREPSLRRVQHLAGLIRQIKERYPIEVCVSAGLLDEEKARVLHDAGLDRYNHNLNTSSGHYSQICTTHTYADRLKTLKAARSTGMEVCSGVIVGMGESCRDVIAVALALRELQARSIPVNFFIPIPGTALNTHPDLTPEYCLRVLCLYRFLNPDAEIRVAAGREYHLRDLEVLALYPANSLFLDGYLNSKGAGRARTLRMIRDAGFHIESEHGLDELIIKEEASGSGSSAAGDKTLKSLNDLRPFMSR